MGDISIKGRSRLLKGGRVGLSRGGGSAPFLRGRSGSSNIKAPRGSEGWKQMQQAEAKIGRAVNPNRIGRLTKGKKDYTDRSIDQKYRARAKKEDAKRAEQKAEMDEVRALGKKLKTGAKIGAAVVGTTIVAGKVKQKLKKKKKKKDEE